MNELRVLGTTLLRGNNGEFFHSFLTGPKRLGLLTFLLLEQPDRYYRRDWLIALFWPESSQRSARNSLSNMLHQIREVLGKDIFDNRGSEEICVRTGRIWCDAIAFEQAVAEKDLDKAMELYHGDLLTGFHAGDVSNEFVSWLDNKQNELREKAADVSWQLSERSNGDQRIHWARKALGLSAFDEEHYYRIIRLLNQEGKRAEALRLYQQFEHDALEDWGITPSREIRELANAIRSEDEVRNNGTKTSRNGLAVLPFETLGEKASAVFTQGIHEDLLARLSSIASVEITSRTSVQKYKDQAVDLKQISRELNVNWVMEGSVQQLDDLVQVRVRLINTLSDRQVWANNFQKKLNAKNLFRIQSDITKQIAAELKTTLTPDEKRQVEKNPTNNIAAYRLYTQGWSWIEQRTEKGMRRGMDFFEQALDIDDSFGLARVGKAFALLGLFGYGFEPAEASLPEAEALISQALTEDPELAEAHTAMGLLQTSRQEGPEATRSLREAIKIRPGYNNAHNKLSWISQLIGDPDTALSSAAKAVDLDPFSPESLINLTFSHLIKGDPQYALTLAKKTNKLQPDWTTGIFYHSIILFELEEYEESGRVLDDISVEWAPFGPRLLRALLAQKLNNPAPDLGSDDKLSHAVLLAVGGETGKALDLMENITHWDAWPTLLMRYLFPILLKDVRQHPRFQSVLKLINQSWNM